MGKSHFSVPELCCSNSFPRLVEVPPEGSATWKNLQNLIDKLLDPVRDKLAQPVRVTSGFRPKRLNDAVKGAKNSNHLCIDGAAADIHTGNNSTDNVKIIKAILQLGLMYDEVIAEGAKFDANGNLKSCEWVHVAVKTDPKANRMKFLYTVDKKTYYQLKKTIITDVKLTR